MKRYTRIVISFVFALFAGPLHAQADYPVRPVRLILPFAPGGASDFVARILQPRLSELLGQTVVVENRPGAAGNIGVEAAARATPDGHTLFLGNVGTMAINPYIYPKFPFKPLEDFIAVTNVAEVPGVLVIHPSVPAKNAKELIAHLKANPNKLNYGSAGPSSINRLESEIFMKLTGTQMVHIPYKGGAGPMVTGLVAGEVQAAFVTFSTAVGFVKGGRLRALGVVSPTRVDALPDVPTMPELGFKDMTVGSWQGIFVPKGTPQKVVAKIFTATTKTLEHPDVVKRLSEGGQRVMVSRSPEEFRKFVKSENDRFAVVVKELGITGD
jgi:tripartite-type tricarboxylate transporter receptor subunit TctC